MAMQSHPPRRSSALAIVLLFSTALHAAGSAETHVPAIEDGPPRPGHFVKVVAPEYQGTAVFHALYLPTDWEKGNSYPVIVEYAGNSSGTICSGKVEDCKLGYYASGGAGYIWIVLPFVNEKEKRNQLTWWGDVDATVKYCEVNVRRACDSFGGDRSAIVLTGFSRGAIACGYIGLHDDTIASMWVGLLPFAHFDGGSFTRDGAKERLARIKDRPVLIAFGQKDAAGKANSLAGAAILKALGGSPQLLEIPDIGHTDNWIEKPSPQRDEVRKWLSDVTAHR
jgi:predicted esterase